MTVTVEPDYVMQKVVRELGRDLLDEVTTQSILEDTWRILHGNVSPVPQVPGTLDELRGVLRERFFEVPYTLAYQGYKTMEYHLRPPKPVSPELKRLAGILDSFMGRTTPERTIQS